MAQIIGKCFISGIRGKLCQEDGTYVAQNRQTGKMHLAELKNPYKGEPSELQAERRTAFANQVTAINAWLKLAKQQGHATYYKYLAAFKSQHKCGTLRGYMMSLGDKLELPELRGE